jgi:hypothetical protein
MPFPGYMVGIVAITMIFSILSIDYENMEKDEQVSIKNFFQKKLI